MRLSIFSLAMMAAALTAHAGIDTPLTVDFSGRTAPALDVYASNVKTFRVSVLNTGAAVNLTGYTPVFFWAVSNQATAVVTASCSVVSTSGGVFNATLSASDLNYAGGSYIYGVGVTSNGTTTARQGVLRIIPDPLASGAGPVTWTTNLNWSLYTFVDGGGNGPYLFAGASLATNSRGQVTVTITGATASAAFGALTGSPYDNTILGSALTGTSNGAVASARSQAVTSVWTAAQYAGALLTDGTRAMSGNLDAGTRGATNLQQLAFSATNDPTGLFPTAHWSIMASGANELDVYGGGAIRLALGLDELTAYGRIVASSATTNIYDPNYVLNRAANDALYAGKTHNQPWSTITNAPPGMTPDNTASVTWQATATSAQGVVTWQATALYPSYVVDGGGLISVDGVARKLQHGGIDALAWSVTDGTALVAVANLVASNSMTIGGVTRTNWPAEAGAETDPVWLASGISNRVVTLEGYTNRAATAYGWGNHATNGYVTADTGATGIVAAAADAYNPTTRVLTWNTNAASGGGGGGSVPYVTNALIQALGSIPATAGATQTIDLTSGTVIQWTITNTPLTVTIGTGFGSWGWSNYGARVITEITHAGNGTAYTCVWPVATWSIPGGLTQLPLSQSSNALDLIEWFWDGTKYRMLNAVYGL